MGYPKTKQATEELVFRTNGDYLCELSPVELFQDETPK